MKKALAVLVEDLREDYKHGETLRINLIEEGFDNQTQTPYCWSSVGKGQRNTKLLRPIY